jgi:5-methylcytosine-specific restriction endonuclease McrA
MPRPLARPTTRRALALCAAAHAPAHAPAPAYAVQASAALRRRARHALAPGERAGDARGPRRGLRGRGGALTVCAKRALKRATLRDCGRRCVYCAVELAPESATLDHVYPRARGGPDVAGNVVAACLRCNRMKADLLPSEFFLRHPWAGLNFVRYARAVHRALKRGARRAVSLAYAAEAEGLRAA